LRIDVGPLGEALGHVAFLVLRRRCAADRPVVGTFSELFPSNCCGGKVKEETPDKVISEYEAIRDEITLRLKAQQDIVNYSLVVAGLLAPLVGLRSTVGLHNTLEMLLIGPVICIFLQGIYFKHHIFIELLSSYISTELGRGSKDAEESLPFAGWEHYLTSSLYERRLTNISSGFLGLLEAGVPSVVAVAYLVSFLTVAQGVAGGWGNLKPKILRILLVIEFSSVFAVNVVGGLVRRWVFKRRRAARTRKAGERTEQD
jgi:hypothetical protein